MAHCVVNKNVSLRRNGKGHCPAAHSKHRCRQRAMQNAPPERGLKLFISAAACFGRSPIFCFHVLFQIEL